jgi:hypothetical protein
VSIERLLGWLFLALTIVGLEDCWALADALLDNGSNADAAVESRNRYSRGIVELGLKLLNPIERWHASGGKGAVDSSRIHCLYPAIMQRTELLSERT